VQSSAFLKVSILPENLCLKNVEDCQIAKTSCTVALDKDTSIKVNILPRGIPETDTLSISIDTQGERIDTASVVLQRQDCVSKNYPSLTFGDYSSLCKSLK
jgi:hypothetical protein